MTGMLAGPRPLPKGAALVIAFGLFLTLRGYHSRDNDQAYRLPLLFDRQVEGLYAHDPFVRAFDAFNPHQGSLLLLDLASRPFGLSFGLFALYATTFALTFVGFDRLARAVWPEGSRWLGMVAFALVLAAKAGNIGTNHLFEPILLDRLIATALGWVALAAMIADRRAAPMVVALLIGLAAWVHPSLGLQLGMLVGACWAGSVVAPSWFGAPRRSAWLGLTLLGAALAPTAAAMSIQGDALLKGMPEEEFRLWTLFVQSPQHMVPHLWRAPQWWAWGCYGALAALSVASWFRDPRHTAEGVPFAGLDPARRRFLFAHVVLLTGLAFAYLAIEWLGDLRVTLFQPFRMATVARGLALVAIAGRIVALWGRGDLLSRSRAALIIVGLTGDWSMVVATLVELAATVGNRIDRRAAWVATGATLLAGLHFLSRHDTQSGHVRLLFALGVVAMFGVVESRTRLLARFQSWTAGRIARATVLSWTLPVFALVFPVVPLADTETGRPIAGWLVDRCRFAAIPRDDIERLAVWCREHTAPDARFVGPPGPKTFRLWSLRSLAFNRAGSPYHAAGLADWAERFRAHVAFEGTATEFARAYLDNRQALERRYDALDADRLAALAEDQGAGYVIASANLLDDGEASRPALEPLHAEGEYAVYRVRPVAVAEHPGGQRR